MKTFRRFLEVCDEHMGTLFMLVLLAALLRFCCF